MAASVIGAATHVGSTTPLTVPVPTGTAVNDVIIYFADNYGLGGVGVPPAGSVAITGINTQNTGDSQQVLGAWYQVMVGTPPSSYTFTTSGVGGNVDVYAISVRGLNLVTPVDNTGGGTSAFGNSNTVAAPSITTTSSGLLLWFFFGDDTPLSAAGPSGFTTQVSATGAPNNKDGGYSGLYSKITSSSGATGIISQTTTAADFWNVALIALIAAGGTTPVNDALFFNAD